MREQQFIPERTSQISTMPRYELDASVHKWLFDPDQVLREIEKTLRGVIYDSATKKYKRVFKSLLSDDGINMFLYFLRPYTSKIFSLSNFRKADIDIMMLEFSIDLTAILGTENDFFGIDENHLSIVKRIVEDTIFANLRRALNGEGLRLIKETQKTVETVGQKGGNPLNIFSMFSRRE